AADQDFPGNNAGASLKRAPSQRLDQPDARHFPGNNAGASLTPIDPNYRGPITPRPHDWSFATRGRGELVDTRSGQLARGPEADTRTLEICRQDRGLSR